MNKFIRVVLADDHELIRQGLKRIIELDTDIRVVGEAVNGIEALALVKTLSPDLLIVDMNMPQMTGIQVLEELRKQDKASKVIILTIEDDREFIKKCMFLGADGYILKDSAGTEVVRAIEQVVQGDKYLDQALIGMLLRSESFKHFDKSPFDELTSRELDILYQISKGRTNKEIGEILFLAEKTVKNYLTTIFRKIDVKDRVNAVLFAIENQINNYYDEN
ncbi:MULTISPECIES: response regulator transcription factor [unclassified Fusibacter]|uniref:response regulator n=1 Tax=unclassified Fusibacter TaxID=2624464 RepID=UPI001010FBC6|nr:MULTISPECIES: response regulator transcription factor [unclassified Fusibacter]MCK8059967.1 response regulator transcription factor [Fusibacter sp. A2]NPE22109.1 response regulator transcription factor [Fusibacter sp. A1]RXV60887.1 DNA-binding response regulator [Fusibacter sp. A1]